MPNPNKNKPLFPEDIHVYPAERILGKDNGKFRAVLSIGIGEPMWGYTDYKFYECVADSPEEAKKGLLDIVIKSLQNII